MEFKKKHLLIVVVIICVALYFYGSKINQDYVSSLPVIGGLAFGLNTLIQLAH